MNKLIIWDQNWADEFDIFGFEIISKNDFEPIIKTLDYIKENDSNLYNREEEFYYGTNEYVTLSYEDFHKVILNSKSLSNEEDQILNNIFGDLTYGKGMTFGGRFMDQLYSYCLDNKLNIKWNESNWFLIKKPKKIATITEIYEYEIDVTDYEDCNNEAIKSDIEHNIHDGFYNHVSKDLIVQVNIDNYEG